jgi:unsaturated chondroitin disaccharide hydrolase
VITIPAEDRQWAEQVWGKIKIKISAQCGRMGLKTPYVAVDGRYTDKMAENIYWWCNGFWPGMLWLLYHDTKENPYQETAQGIEERLDEALCGYEGLHHDVGFMWTLTSRLNYQLTSNPASRVRALHAANLLAGRYNPRGRFIRSWNKQYTGWVIIDCMMNLPLLYWAGEQLEDPRYRYIAVEHTETVLKYLVREDGSCGHIAVLNPDNGDLLETPAGQGYAAGSSWSRGQAWALYGFALALQYTGEERYGAAAQRIAAYVVAALSRCGFVPPVDFRAPDEPLKIDTSAGMITAAGLLCLADQSGGDGRKFYYDSALKILKTLEKTFCDWDPGRDSVVQRGSAQYSDRPGENDVPLIYADYFFLEAVHYILHPEFRVW